MIKKLLSMILVAMTVLLPFQGQAFAVTFTAQGTVSSVSTFSASLLTVAADAAATQINFAAGTGIASGDAYINVSFNDNTLGVQAVLISTDNRNNTATPAIPKYSGIAQGSGLVGLTNKDLVVPLKWAVFDSKVTGGYTFTNATGEFFIQDLSQGTTSASQNITTGASACNDINKNNICDAGEFTDRNGNSAFDAVIWISGNANSRCPSTFEGTDWDGDCYDGAKPYDNGFGSVVSGIAGTNASLSGAAGSSIDTTRTTTDGNVKVYIGTDYTGAEAQTYKTNKLTFTLATIA